MTLQDSSISKARCRMSKMHSRWWKKQYNGYNKLILHHWIRLSCKSVTIQPMWNKKFRDNKTSPISVTSQTDWSTRLWASSLVLVTTLRVLPCFIRRSSTTFSIRISSTSLETIAQSSLLLPFQIPLKERWLQLLSLSFPGQVWGRLSHLPLLRRWPNSVSSLILSSVLGFSTEILEKEVLVSSLSSTSSTTRPEAFCKTSTMRLPRSWSSQTNTLCSSTWSTSFLTLESQSKLTISSKNLPTKDNIWFIFWSWKVMFKSRSKTLRICSKSTNPRSLSSRI